MLYKSTRGDENNLTFETVLFGTYSREGGLYVSILRTMEDSRMYL